MDELVSQRPPALGSFRRVSTSPEDDIVTYRVRPGTYGGGRHGGGPIGQHPDSREVLAQPGLHIFTDAPIEGLPAATGKRRQHGRPRRAIRRNMQWPGSSLDRSVVRKPRDLTEIPCLPRRFSNGPVSLLLVLLAKAGPREVSGPLHAEP